ncbi:MAG: type 1 glutamine amidotransferase [Lentimicrobium sp.]|nr:type 1 glutamine amidotransferase [Lentimicrobium sp.]
MNTKNKKIICFVHSDFEDLELWYPILRLRGEGFTVHIAGDLGNHIYVGKYGVPAKSDFGFDEIDAANYDGLLIPGGWAPDKLRRSPDVLKITREMMSANKPVAQICHAGWVLVSAGVLKGRKVTSTPGIKDDMINAGATWVDEAVVVDGNLVSSQKPADLPFYMNEYLKLL